MGEGSVNARDARRVCHSMAELLRTACLLVVQGRDHDAATVLRDDPAFPLVASTRVSTTRFADGHGLLSVATLVPGRKPGRAVQRRLPSLHPPRDPTTALLAGRAGYKSAQLPEARHRPQLRVEQWHRHVPEPPPQWAPPVCCHVASASPTVGDGPLAARTFPQLNSAVAAVSTVIPSAGATRLAWPSVTWRLAIQRSSLE